MSLIDEKNIEDLKNYPDCKNCIHYWLHKEKELCTKEGIQNDEFPDNVCDEFEKV